MTIEQARKLMHQWIASPALRIHMESVAACMVTARVLQRAAIDHAHVKPDAAIAGAREIAFFPPMTGG